MGEELEAQRSEAAAMDQGEVEALHRQMEEVRQAQAHSLAEFKRHSKKALVDVVDRVSTQLSGMQSALQALSGDLTRAVQETEEFAKTQVAALTQRVGEHTLSSRDRDNGLVRPCREHRLGARCGCGPAISEASLLYVQIELVETKISSAVSGIKSAEGAMLHEQAGAGRRPLWRGS